MSTSLLGFRYLSPALYSMECFTKINQLVLVKFRLLHNIRSLVLLPFLAIILNIHGRFGSCRVAIVRVLKEVIKSKFFFSFTHQTKLHDIVSADYWGFIDKDVIAANDAFHKRRYTFLQTHMLCLPITGTCTPIHASSFLSAELSICIKHSNMHIIDLLNQHETLEQKVFNIDFKLPVILQPRSDRNANPSKTSLLCFFYLS